MKLWDKYHHPRFTPLRWIIRQIVEYADIADIQWTMRRRGFEYKKRDPQ